MVVRFEHSNGEELDPLVAYQVYNSFILFHGFVDGYTEEGREGKGIAELRRIGQKIVEEGASFQESPIDFGEHFSEGSIFTSGEITLEFKGISVVDDLLCAIVGYDAGESSFTMLLEPFPGFVVKTDGGTLIHGDLYVDLESKWVTKGVITYRDVTMTTMGGEKIASGVMGTTVTIKVAHTFHGGIEGTVTWMEKPAAGMRVGIVSGTTGFPEIAVETNDGGYYQIGSVPPGTFEVAVHDKEGNRIGLESVVVRGGETSTLNFVIP
jgi:hypothetical protein